MTWKDRIVEAKKNKKFTEADIADCKKWFTCAIGEKIDFKSVGSFPDNPVEHESWIREHCDKASDFIIGLGLDFYHHVTKGNISGAEKTYNKIQEIEL